MSHTSIGDTNSSDRAKVKARTRAVKEQDREEVGGKAAQSEKGCEEGVYDAQIR